MEHRSCGKCSLYSRQLLRCIHGKVNPRTKKGTKDAMRLFGPSYICNYNKWKEKAINELVEERKEKESAQSTL